MSWLPLRTLGHPPSEFGSEQEVISETTTDGDSTTTVPATTKKYEASKEGTLELDKAQFDDWEDVSADSVVLNQNQDHKTKKEKRS